MPKFPGFIFGSNSTQAYSLDAEKSINLYVERAQAPGVRNPDGALLSVPGFKAWSTGTTDVGTRALDVAAGRLFGVIGGGFYEFSNTGVATRHGTVAQDSNPAQLIYNGTVGGQLGIASGGSIYTFVLSSNTFAGPHFAGATTTMLNFADGYGLAFAQGTGRVYLSALNNFTSWDLATFFQRSKFPDTWQTMFVDANGLIWMIGTETFEVWYNTGTGTQPWAVLSGLYGRWGIAAPFAYSVSSLGQYWLGQSPDGGIVPVATRGSVPQSVSSYACEKALQDIRRSGSISGAELLTYHDQGQTFPCFSFPNQNSTWVYSVQEKLWHERGKWDSATQKYLAWAPRVHADCFNKHLVGDRTTGTIWEMDTAYATDVDGHGIRRLRRTPGLTDEHQRHPIDRLQLLMDVGVGTQTGQGSNPRGMLRVSDDQGNTWSNELWRSLGRVGQYRQPVVWDRLGAKEDTMLEFVVSDPVPVRITDAWVNNAEKPAVGRAA